MKRKEIAKINLPVAMIQAVDAIYAKIPDVKCQGHCVDCCIPVGDMMTPLERDRIIKATGKRPNGEEDRVKGKKCNFLENGKCFIHKIRPSICRLYGVDSGMRCKFGCEGANALSPYQGHEFTRAIRKAVNAYKTGELEELFEKFFRGE